MTDKHKTDKEHIPHEQNEESCCDHSTDEDTTLQSESQEVEDELELFIPAEAQTGKAQKGQVIHKSQSELLKVTPGDFIKFFPKVKLPQTLNEESIHTFNQYNKPFTEGAELSYLREPTDDEFTEYLPCFRIKTEEGIHVLVYWKAGLMDHHYYVMTMDKKGNIIAKTPIAGIRSDGDKVARLYAYLDEDFVVHMMAGEAKIDREEEYNPGDTKTFEAEILPDGQIIFEETDNLFDE